MEVEKGGAGTRGSNRESDGNCHSSQVATNVIISLGHWIVWDDGRANSSTVLSELSSGPQNVTLIMLESKVI